MFENSEFRFPRDPAAGYSSSSSWLARPVAPEPCAVPMPFAETLRCAWVLWEIVEQPTSICSTRIRAFTTVAGFLDTWKNIPKPSDLLRPFAPNHFLPDLVAGPINGIGVFRDGISPDWLDPMNAEGGHVQVGMSKASVIAHESAVDESWTKLVLLAIAEWLSGSRQVAGIILHNKLGKKRLPAIKIDLFYVSGTTEADIEAVRQSMLYIFPMWKLKRVEHSRGLLQSNPSGTAAAATGEDLCLVVSQDEASQLGAEFFFAPDDEGRLGADFFFEKPPGGPDGRLRDYFRTGQL